MRLYTVHLFFRKYVNSHYLCTMAPNFKKAFFASFKGTAAWDFLPVRMKNLYWIQLLNFNVYFALICTLMYSHSNYFTLNLKNYHEASFVVPKDHIEKIDFQELIFAVVNWPNSELYWAFVCIIRSWLVCLQTNRLVFSWFRGVGFCRFLLNWFIIKKFMG